jgi:hypothetical protein
MKINNSYIEDFATFILSFRLKGKENRMRNRFVKILQQQLKLIQEEHKELLEEYCKKDAEGNFNTINKDGRSFYDIDDVRGFQVEFDILMQEYFIIPNDEANTEMLTTVKEIILNCDKEFSGQEALKYETYCEMFEEENQITII